MKREFFIENTSKKNHAIGLDSAGSCEFPEYYFRGDEWRGEFLVDALCERAGIDQESRYYDGDEPDYIYYIDIDSDSNLYIASAYIGSPVAKFIIENYENIDR